MKTAKRIVVFTRFRQLTILKVEDTGTAGIGWALYVEI